MKVAMDTPEQVRNYSPDIAKDTTLYRTSDSQGTREWNGFTLDISGNVMDNTAYGGHGKTTEDVMQAAGNEDLVSWRNYMAIMSNTMSEEDFAKLQEEGIRPGDVEIETVVTIVDHIKAAMVQGGMTVTGYTDDLNRAQLEQITGNQALAQELAGQLREKDLPVTHENAKAAAQAWEKAKGLEPLTEGAEKFLIENQLPPTIENLYLAQYSGGAEPGRQGRGYYSQEMNGGRCGYYAKKAEEYNWETLENQMAKVIEKAGFAADEEALKDGKWLIEKGIPLTPESFGALRELKELPLPQTEEKMAAAIAAAIADGKNPLAANLCDVRSNLEKAIAYVEEAAEIKPQTIDIVLSEKQQLTWKNLREAGHKTDREQADWPLQENPSKEAMAARRQLEEIRLKMTVEANVRLLRRGFSIETAPLEQLVDQLKEAEAAIQMQLTGASDKKEAALRFSAYQETVAKVSQISAMPASLAGRMAMADPENLTTLHGIHESGVLLQSAYEKAGETYEAVMTVPRKDMGDSIRKAFRNVDSILKEKNLEVNESNRRAIRILGYNNMELSEENIVAVKEKDSLLQEVIRKCKPGRILEMIREKVNPLTMDLEELQSYLSKESEKPDKAASAAERMEDYSRFLYKLEQRNGITEQEREAYIGVYRLLRQIEKGDSAVIGTVVNAKMEFSMGNLLTAIRSGKKQGMEVLVKEEYAGADPASLRKDVKQIMSELMDDPESAKADRDYHQEEAREIRAFRNTEDVVIQTLLDHRQPVTWNHLMAAGNMIKYPGMLFRKAGRYARETNQEEEWQENIQNLHENLTDQASAEEAYRQLQETVTGIFENAADADGVKALDVRELGRMCRQISLNLSFAKEERYEIPVEIGGELAAVHLRVLHTGAKEGKVTVSLQTEEAGQIYCEFTVRNKTWNGYVVCQEKTGFQKLKQSEERLKDILNSHIKGNDRQNGGQKEEIQIGTIRFVQSEKTEFDSFSQEKNAPIDSEEQTEKVSAKDLYVTAKAFIEYIQKALPS